MLCVVLALPLTLAYADSCFTARGVSASSPLTWSAIFILDSLETTVEYNIPCCGCGTQMVWAQLISDDEGLLFSLTDINEPCPIKGQWTSTDPVPLTPQRVQALKDGKLSLYLMQPTCDAQWVPGDLTLESCEE